MGNKNSGRKTVYTEEIANELFERLANGESLNSICKDSHMPGHRTVREWEIKDKPKGFSTKYARARNFGLDNRLEELLDASKNCPADMTKIAAAKFYADNLKWAASKLFSKRYGDRQVQEHEGSVTIVFDKEDKGVL